jgi:dTDP-glucose 4,6-dehydratase
MKVLVTGGLGFIGSNLIRLILRKRPDWRVVNLDLVTYAANPANLRDVEASNRYEFVKGDVADRSFIADLYRTQAFDATVHCAAETHVDRSIEDSGAFLRTNIEGSVVLGEAALAFGGIRHVQVSTDEVYGSLMPDEAPFSEDTPLAPRSPYSASKAAADQMMLAFHHTYGLDVVITRCSNNYGPYQHPEKLIPLMITSALHSRVLPVYGDGRQRRDWIHVEDHCRGLLAALERGRAGEVYNFGGAAERENIEVVRSVVEETGADPALIAHVTDRPGHDRRYAITFDKAQRELGWQPQFDFEAGLSETIAWYREHAEWWGGAALTAYQESSARLARWAAQSSS